MKFCPNCGTQLPDGVIFCGSCGTKIGTPNTQQSYAYQPAGAFGAHRLVQTDRSLFIYIILSIVTCGIYGLYFIYKLAEDANEMCFDDGEKTPGLGMYILLSLVTCGFYSYYWLYKLQNRFYAAGPRYGIPISENGTTVLVWYILGSFICGIGAFVGMNIIISSANKVGTAYNMKYVYNR